MGDGGRMLGRGIFDFPVRNAGWHRLQTRHHGFSNQILMNSLLRYIQ